MKESSDETLKELNISLYSYRIVRGLTLVVEYNHCDTIPLIKRVVVLM